MLIETLPFDRYNELLQFEEFQQNGLPGPLSVVVVAIDSETKEIKGYWVSQAVMHSEPVWISPEVRGGLTGIKMLAKLLKELSLVGVTAHFAFADRPEIADYLDILGLTELPWRIFVGPVPSATAEKKE